MSFELRVKKGKLRASSYEPRATDWATNDKLAHDWQKVEYSESNRTLSVFCHSDAERGGGICDTTEPVWRDGFGSVRL